MPHKKTNVILANYPDNSCVLATQDVKIGNWTEQQRQDFLTKLNQHKGWEFIDGCAVSVHFDKSVIHARSFDAPKTFTPYVAKNKPNELLIEIIPNMITNECPACFPAGCPACLRDGECTSPFIKEYIGNVLFPNKYNKQK
jgi:hypothetical protein